MPCRPWLDSLRHGSTVFVDELADQVVILPCSFRFVAEVEPVLRAILASMGERDRIDLLRSHIAQRCICADLPTIACYVLCREGG